MIQFWTAPEVHFCHLFQYLSNMRIFFAFALSIVLSFSLCGQNMADYTASWEGALEDSKAFSFTIEIKGSIAEGATFSVSNKRLVLSKPLDWMLGQPMKVKISPTTSFEGNTSEDGKEITGFVKSGILLYHVSLVQTATNTFTGTWNLMMVEELLSDRFYLSVENGARDDYEAYPFLADDRFTGTWCGNFRKRGAQISFSDMKTGLQFRGKLLPESIQLGAYFGKHLITNIDLKKSETEWNRGGFSTNEAASAVRGLRLKEMEELILNDSLESVHSVLVSRKGKTVYERYFHGYSANVPHDTRSASKSIGSAIVGIAKDKGLVESVDQSLFDFLPEEYQVYKDAEKAEIDLQSLLTMSSGLDAIDFGIEGTSAASEDSYQSSDDWVKTVLEAPMIYEPNTHANYGSANPFLLGLAMRFAVSEPLETFMDQHLFKELGITNYIIQTDVGGHPYFGGGMYLTPRDLMKFGELYLNQGKWNGKQVISESWVEESFQNYLVLENANDKNGYGYLWWHHSYEVGGKTLKSIEARGSGGQYIFVIPELEMVAVITSGNYRNGKTQQPELILEQHILPNLLK